MLTQFFNLKKTNSMLHKSLFSSIFFLTFLTQGYCKNLTQQKTSYNPSQPLIEAKAGYFFFTEPKMSKVYDHGGIDVQLSFSYPVWNPIQRLSLNAYASIEYFQSSGKSLHTDKNTFIWAIPVNIGIKPTIAITPIVQYYCTLGPRYFYIHQHNNSSYVDKNLSRNGIGLFANTGFNFVLKHHFLIDIFGEYAYGKIHFHNHKANVYTRNIQISSITFGGSLGYAF